jgi:hypothetical protein
MDFILISDNDVTLAALKGGLAKSGHNTHPVSLRNYSQSQSHSANQNVVEILNRLKKSNVPCPVSALIDCHLGENLRSSNLGLHLALVLRASFNIPILVWSFLKEKNLQSQGSRLLTYGGTKCWIEAPFTFEELNRRINGLVKEHQSHLISKEQAAVRLWTDTYRWLQASEAIQSFGHQAKKESSSADSIIKEYDGLNSILAELNLEAGLILKERIRHLLLDVELRPSAGWYRFAGQAIEEAGIALRKLLQIRRSEYTPPTLKTINRSALLRDITSLIKSYDSGANISDREVFDLSISNMRILSSADPSRVSLEDVISLIVRDNLKLGHDQT